MTRQEIYGEPAPALDEDLLVRWLRYYTETEAFDRTVCLCRNDDGTAQPAAGYERVLCHRNSGAALQRHRLEGASLRSDERRYAASLSHEGARLLLSQILSLRLIAELGT